MLTKLDIMDRGTDCRDVLQGRTLKLRHGWVAVVNRGQADLNSKVGGGGLCSQQELWHDAMQVLRGSVPAPSSTLCRWLVACPCRR